MASSRNERILVSKTLEFSSGGRRTALYHSDVVRRSSHKVSSRRQRRHHKYDPYDSFDEANAARHLRGGGFFSNLFKSKGGSGGSGSSSGSGSSFFSRKSSSDGSGSSGSGFSLFKKKDSSGSSDSSGSGSSFFRRRSSSSSSDSGGSGSSFFKKFGSAAKSAGSKMESAAKSAGTAVSNSAVGAAARSVTQSVGAAKRAVSTTIQHVRADLGLPESGKKKAEPSTFMDRMKQRVGNFAIKKMKEQKLAECRLNFPDMESKEYMQCSEDADEWESQAQQSALTAGYRIKKGSRRHAYNNMSRRGGYDSFDEDHVAARLRAGFGMRDLGAAFKNAKKAGKQFAQQAKAAGNTIAANARTAAQQAREAGNTIAANARAAKQSMTEGIAAFKEGASDSDSENSDLRGGARRRKKKSATRKRKSACKSKKTKVFMYDSDSDSCCSYKPKARVLDCTKKNGRLRCKSRKVCIDSSSDSSCDSSSSEDFDLKCSRKKNRVICKRDPCGDKLTRSIMRSLSMDECTSSSDDDDDDCHSFRLAGGKRKKRAAPKKKKAASKKKKAASKKKKAAPKKKRVLKGAFKKWVEASVKARKMLAKKHPREFKGKLVLMNKGVYGKKWYALTKKLLAAKK